MEWQRRHALETSSRYYAPMCSEAEVVDWQRYIESAGQNGRSNYHVDYAE